MLSRIIEYKKREVEEARRIFDKQQVIKHSPVNLDFFKNSGQIKVIAEVKKASPSKGILCRDFDPVRLAAAYQKNGAAMISVLTDREFFQGDKSFIRMIKEGVSLPVLRKDFIIDEVQLYESAALDADVVLLIAAMHDYSSLMKLSQKSLELGLEVLMEVHDRDELRMVIDLPVKMIGINNRNLKDFRVDINTSLRLAEHIPDRCIKVSESGISTRDDLILLQEHGFQAALIGEALVMAADPGAKLHEMLSKGVENK
jgi:indole-3-glycerol phosphate synthase